VALALALVEARRIDLGRVLITCDDGNFGSQPIIETNGGVPHDPIAVPGEVGLKRRSRIVPGNHEPG
jgi:predicted acetyltransferase